MKMNRGFAPVLWLLVAILLVSAAFAQETTGGMQGTVKDPQGLVVAKATVEIGGPALIGVKKLETDASGYYRFANMPAGEYTITVTAQGFRTLKQSGIFIAVGKLPTIDLKLEIGGVEQTVEVTSAAPVIDVTATKTQTNITEDLVAMAPQGRSALSVMAFAPSARQEPLQGSGFSVAGAAQTENQYLIEGQDTGNVVNGASTSNTPFEFIQEVTVKSSGIEAEHAGALGGVVNVVQKRGGNKWHGELWSYYEPSGLDANPQSRYWRQDPSAAVTGRHDVAAQEFSPKKDKFTTIQPGFSLGGPLQKDKLWFFMSFAPNYFKRDRTVNMTNTQTTTYTPDRPAGPTTYSHREDTYYTTSRLDYLVTNKIRVFGSWLYQYERISGTSVPNSDDQFGLVNATAGDPVGKYLASMDRVLPNNLFNVGGDITLTPNIVVTTRYGHSFQNDGFRGYPNAPIYWWRASGLSARGCNTATFQCDTTAAYPLVGGVLGSQKSLASNYPAPGYIAEKDASKKDQLTGDVAWFKKGFGTHNFKFGYQFNRIENDPNTYPHDSLVRIHPGRAYNPLSTDGTARCTAMPWRTVEYDENGVPTGGVVSPADSCRGQYGYAVVRDYNLIGKLHSTNHGIYVQDAWTIGKGVTVNAGLRMDKEYLPSDPAFGLPGNKVVDYNFTDKLAPRLGAAWDVFQNGKMKVFGSYGVFFDQMKLGLARGTFGGEYWHDCVYALNTNDPTVIVPVRGTGRHYCNGDQNTHANLVTENGLAFIENIDYRQNASPGSAIDKDLKPYKQHENVLGVDYQLFKNWAFEARWDRRRIDRVIEDAGIIINGSEEFYIVNPGFGRNAKLDETCTGCPSNGVLPKAIRDYDGVEFRLTKSYSSHWAGSLSYTWSRLWGNYSGLTSSDVSDGGTGGRLDPNVSRAFDEAYFMFDAYGKASNGLLATDRPHAFKAYGYYQLPIGKSSTTTFGLFQQWFSGTPLTTYMDVAYNAGSAPTFVEGRSKWVDVTKDAAGNWVYGKTSLRRTPSYSQTDFRATQDFKVNKNNEAQVLGFEVNITNLFNQRQVVAYTSQLNSLNSSKYLNVGTDCSADEPVDCNVNTAMLRGYDWKALANAQGMVVNSLYGQPLQRQGGRAVRLKAKFTF